MARNRTRFVVDFVTGVVVVCLCDLSLESTTTTIDRFSFRFFFLSWSDLWLKLLVRKVGVRIGFSLVAVWWTYCC